MSETKKVDAVLIPDSFKVRAKGPRQYHRIKAILDIAEPLLGVDRATGAKGYLRSVNRRAEDGSEYLFVTTSPDDTLLFPKSHPAEGQPRYRWEPANEGVQVGTLVVSSEL